MKQPLELLTVQIINKSKHANPEYATELSAGMDLTANLECPIVLMPLERALVPTGIYIALPAGYEAQVRPVDAEYRGEIKVILVNLSNEPWTCNDGERIAQLVVASHETVDWIATDSLDDTGRGTGGFGHTGK